MSRWIRRDEVLWRRLHDGWLLVAADGFDDPVHLEGSASDVWELLAVPHTIGELTRSVVAQFGITDVAARGAVESCVAALSRHRLIEADPAGVVRDAEIAPPSSPR